MNVEIPQRMKKFPLWNNKYPIHYTVAKKADGTPIFNQVNRIRQIEAARKNWCQLCGERMQPPYWFICGELDVDQKACKDGPMHIECAKFAIAICPFLANPNYVGKIDVLESAPPAAKEWLIKNNIEGPVERPDKIALCSTNSYQSDISQRYIWFTVDEWLTVDWDYIPRKS